MGPVTPHDLLLLSFEGLMLEAAVDKLFRFSVASRPRLKVLLRRLSQTEWKFMGDILIVPLAKMLCALIMESMQLECIMS